MLQVILHLKNEKTTLNSKVLDQYSFNLTREKNSSRTYSDI